MMESTVPVPVPVPSWQYTPARDTRPLVVATGLHRAEADSGTTRSPPWSGMVGVSAISARVEVVALEPAMDLDPRNAGAAGDRADVPRVLAQERLELALAIGIGGARRSRGLDGRRGRTLPDNLGEVRQPDRAAMGERERDAERVVELSDIERPVVARQRAAGLDRERRRAGVGPAQDRGDQQAEILAALAQRREANHEARDPGVEILAK